MSKPTKKSIDDLNASLDALRVSIAAYHTGTRSVYRGVATELRKLLCDQRGKECNALLPRIFKNFRPHKLQMTPMFEKDPTLLDDLVLMTPCEGIYDGKGGHRSRLLFANPLEKMDLPAWLDQPFLRKSVTVREFIKSVADKEGAHSDPDYNDTLAFSHSIHYAADRSTEDNAIAIGEYVLAYLSIEDMEAHFPGLTRTPRSAPPAA